MRKLKVLRTERQWSQMELARRSGVSQSFVNYLEAGTKQPTLTTLAKLASAFGVTIMDLLEDGEQPFVKKDRTHIHSQDGYVTDSGRGAFDDSIQVIS